MQKAPFIVGVLNVTPDSFSDGGRFTDLEAAKRKAWELIDEGADVIDIGAESTRPGAVSLNPDQEWQRLEPLLNQLCKEGLSERLSVDTRHAQTVKRVLDAFQVGWINNVAGFFDDETMRLIAARPQLKFVAMHMHKTPSTMQQTPLLGDEAVEAVELAFLSFAQHAKRLGLKKEQLFLDPGIGFGKDLSGNLKLLGKTSEWSKEQQTYLGISRKSFLGKLLGIEVAEERDAASKTLEFGLILMGARAIRTHWVKPVKDMCKLYFGE